MSHVGAMQRLAYAAPAFALAIVGIPVYVFLPKFYTDVVGVEIGVVGVLLLGVRLFDAFTDPMVGVISDGARTRFGRRRPFILGASLPLAISIWLLFSPPDLGPGAAALWLGLWIFALFLCWTLIVVPYESLGPEITFDYHERTSLLGLRDGMLVAGTLAASASPALIGWAFGLGDGPEGERARFFWMAALYTPLLVLLCAWCVISVPERPRSRSGPDPKRLDLRSIARNRPFVILLVSYTVSAIGSNLPATLILFYVQYVLRSDLAGLFLVLYLGTGVLFLPAWIALSKRIGKKAAWISGMALNTGAFVCVFFLGAGDAALYGVLVFLSGLGFGATVAIPSSMEADVIDYDELLSGQRREGRYLGIWSIARKLAAALGVGLALPILGAVGYQPGVEQTPQVELALRTMYALVPSLCNGVALLIALYYPIDQGVHTRILEGIALRREGLEGIDPLAQPT
jgi:GPH family glycoside/pentoside/hexuronide:cation symporter